MLDTTVNNDDDINIGLTHFLEVVNTFPNDKFQTLPNLELAEDNFKFDENDRKFSKREENTVGKGEIARHEQFLLFLQYFQKTCTADKLKPGIIW